MASETPFNMSFVLKSQADVAIEVSGRHIYDRVTGNDPWGLSIYLDGNLIRNTGGAGAGTDGPYIKAGLLGLGAGGHTIQVKWFGATNITLSYCDLEIRIRYR
jgi:hypothetical protein